MMDRKEPPQNSDRTDDDTTRPELPDGADFDPDNAPSGGMMQGGPGGGGDSELYIKITGGTLTVSADGDGLDSNGSLLVTGGTTIVYGPTSDGDGALDYDGGATVTGGTLAAIGSAGMTQAFGEDSTQPSITNLLLHRNPVRRHHHHPHRQRRKRPLHRHPGKSLRQHRPHLP